MPGLLIPFRWMSSNRNLLFNEEGVLAKESIKRTCIGCKHNPGWGHCIGGPGDTAHPSEEDLAVEQKLLEVHGTCPCVECYEWAYPNHARDLYEEGQVDGKEKEKDE